MKVWEEMISLFFHTDILGGIGGHKPFCYSQTDCFTLSNIISVLKVLISHSAYIKSHNISGTMFIALRRHNCLCQVISILCSEMQKLSF